MADNEADVFVKFENVQKSYDGEFLIAKDLNFCSFGPSGSGKTTCIRLKL